MKKISWILCILLIFIFIFTLSACKVEGYESHIMHNNMWFCFVPEKSEQGKDYYYIAGNLKNNMVKKYFIPMFVNGLPVRSFGYNGFGSENGSINLQDSHLQKLYMPGTITHQSNNCYLYNVHRDMQFYYCGEVIDLYKIDSYGSKSYKFDYYVPADKLSSFQEVFNQGESTTCGFYKANIAYRLNTEDMCEYYYVDNVEAGSKIENIPPEPTRSGYTFGGWYTEKECVNKWNFDNVPTVSNNDDAFVEFALYAKWVKK